jgi:hypothetical protein
LRIYCGRACRDEALRRVGNAGTFSAGQAAHNRLLVGTTTVRTRNGRGDGPRAWIKVAEPNVWRPRAVLVWEAEHGPIPRGWIVHHENRDTLDDTPGNLSLISRAGHLREHRHEFEQKRKEAAASATRRRFGSATSSPA